MKNSLLSVAAIALCAIAGAASAQNPNSLAWDGYVKVAALQTPEGPWLHCDAGELSLSANKCLDDQMFRVVEMSPPKRLSLQEVLDRHSRAVPGTRWIAVGALPAYTEERYSKLDPRSVFIAYRIIGSPAPL